MFIAIGNEPRDYPWGSPTAIAELLGRAPGGGPEAELWFGAHPGSPSRILEPGRTGGATSLDAWIAAAPDVALGPGRTTLPFLLKLLAADRALSLQVHPNVEQARAGFERENAEGVPLDSPQRNYKDSSAKPELVLALSPTMEALAGFRHVSETRLLLAELTAVADGDDRVAIGRFAEQLQAGADPAVAGATGSALDVARYGAPTAPETVPADADGDANPLHQTVAWLLDGGDGIDAVVRAITVTAARMGTGSSFGREWATVADLAEQYPGDPGIALSLLLNRVSLRQGQAMYLAAGSIHAYLHGVGVEIMAASDNVLRGGLTGKHIDVAELLDVVDFVVTPAPIVQSDSPTPGVVCFRPDTDDFVLAQVALGEAGYDHGYQLAGPAEATFALTGPAIAFVLTGGVAVRGQHDSASLGRGDAIYLTPDEGAVTFAGSGLVFVATTP